MSVTGIKALTPAMRRTLGDDVADRLRDAILRGEFAPGEHLREEELAAMLQVSRGPVRDALGVLERDGLVTVSRHRGASVVALTRADLDEVYSLRIALEALAARHVVDRAEPEDLSAVDAALDDFIHALDGRPTEHEVAQLDVAFHDTVYRAAHHQRLYAGWTGIRLQVYRFLLHRDPTGTDWGKNLAVEHRNLTAVLHGDDADAAVEATISHIRSAYLQILEGFSPGERPSDLVTAPIVLRTTGTARGRRASSKRPGRPDC